MLQKNISKIVGFYGIQKEQIYSNNQFESLIVSVEKGIEIPNQPAPANAGLYVIIGKIEFEVEGIRTVLETDDFFSFSIHQIHSLKALENSKFIISRNLKIP